MTSIDPEFLINLLRPPFNAPRRLYTLNGVEDIRRTTNLLVRRIAWLAQRHPKLALRHGILLQNPKGLIESLSDDVRMLTNSLGAITRGVRRQRAKRGSR